MTNLVLAVASVMLQTNTVENLHPSGDMKTLVETVTARISVPFVFEDRPVVLTNIVVLKSNATTLVWQKLPKPPLPPMPAKPLKQSPSLRPPRDPLGNKDGS